MGEVLGYLHPTMVRLQLAFFAKHNPAILYNLHPTMVRLQLPVRAAGSCMWADTSPSHYGSTATLEVLLRKHLQRIISIPLWFDCNRATCGVAPRRNGHLHPTMVRLQPPGDVKVITQDLINLHPTMVRLQRGSRGSSRNWKSYLHPTMVRLQPTGGYLVSPG